MLQPEKANTITANPGEETSQSSEPEQIAALAYALWQARGCPEGSPEVDWFQAEQNSQLRNDSYKLS
jgi:Protein of unknown function (DUF2934)